MLIPVDLGPRSYTIVVQAGALASAAGRTGRFAEVRTLRDPAGIERVLAARTTERSVSA